MSLLLNCFVSRVFNYYLLIILLIKNIKYSCFLQRTEIFFDVDKINFFCRHHVACLGV